MAHERVERIINTTADGLADAVKDAVKKGAIEDDPFTIMVEEGTASQPPTLPSGVNVVNVAPGERPLP